MSVLVVVAHPDDEVLGAGGTCHVLAQREVEINLCILSGNVEARTNRPELEALFADIGTAAEAIGAKDKVLGDFPNVKLNSVPHIDLVQFIETQILRFRPNYIFTHHPADLNNDHMHTALACMAAARLFQRRPELTRINGLYAMEILSSTDWAFPGHAVPFQPNVFHEIGEAGIEAKIAALAAYRGVLRNYPHPRSVEALRAQAAIRGAQAGLNYAEAFQLLMGDLPIGPSVFMTTYSSIFKPIIDVAVALVLLVLLSPVFLLVALVIWLEDRGACLFRSATRWRKCGTLPDVEISVDACWIGKQDERRRR